MTLNTTAEDRHRVSQGLFSYCRGLDRFDRALALSPFDPAAHLVYTELFEGTPAQFMDWIWPIHERMPVHVHRVTNIFLERRPDGVLVSESYVHVILRTVSEDGSLVDNVGNGRYIDRWEEADGELRIVERGYVRDMSRRYPFHEGPLAAPPQSDAPSLTWARDRSDASYRLLGG
jgi:hypothetical protein